jgi:hypothetical protein
MDAFALRNHLVSYYEQCVQSFMNIRDERIRERVREEMDEGLLWPDPLIQLNPAFEAGAWVDELVAEGLLHPECSRVFRVAKGGSEEEPSGQPLRLHRHQT